MENRITGKDLKAALGSELDRLFEEVALAVSQRPTGVSSPTAKSLSATRRCFANSFIRKL